MKKKIWLAALLACSNLCVWEAHAQADNYMKHVNDETEQVLEQDMTFYLVFKSHFDIGYSALARDVVHEYRTSMIDKAMDVIDRNIDKMSGAQFVWTVPGWPLTQMLWEKQTPERRLRIEKALKNGNLVTHALPYTTHTETRSSKETYELGYNMGKNARAGDVYCLDGDLGVGKTVFTQGFAKGLGINEPINSPTFTIVQEYHDGRLPLYHFDVYRIGDITEMDEIGYEEYFYSEGVCLIEWGNLISEIMPENATYIKISKDLSKGFDYRKIEVTK